MAVTRDPSRSSTVFRPHFTLMLLYLFAAFAIFALLLVVPELVHVFRNVPVGPEQQQAAQELVREVAGPRIRIAFLLALATVALGAWTGVLPGLRRR